MCAGTGTGRTRREKVDLEIRKVSCFRYKIGVWTALVRVVIEPASDREIICIGPLARLRGTRASDGPGMCVRP